MERTIQTPVLEHRLRGKRQPDRLSDHPAARVSGRCAGVGWTWRRRSRPPDIACWCRTSADTAPTTIPRRGRAPHGRAGGDRPGPHRFCRRAGSATGSRWRGTTGAAVRRRLPRRCIPIGCARPFSSAAIRSRTSFHRRDRRRRSRGRRSGISGTSTPSAGAPGWLPTVGRCASCCGRCGRPRGISPTRRTTRRRCPSTTRISWTASSTPIDTGI